MSTFDTVKSITDNIAKVLRTLKLNVTFNIIEDPGNIARSNLPQAQIIYSRDQPEYTRAQRQSYRESFFDINIIFDENKGKNLITQTQKWTHAAINGLTVDALNIGDLSSSLLVTLVEIQDMQDIEYEDTRGILLFTLMVRYRDEDT